MNVFWLAKKEVRGVDNRKGLLIRLRRYASRASGTMALLIAVFALSIGAPAFAQEAKAKTSQAPDETAATGEQENAKANVPAAPQEKAQPAAPAPAPASSSAQAAPAAAAPEAKKAEEAAPPVEPGNVTVNFKGADIRTVLSYISEVAGVDIVPAPDVSGTIDLKLTNKPWKTALDIIVRNYGFAYEREGDIIRVVTISKLKQEELVTQAFNLNYSKARTVTDSVKNIVGERGKVVYDERTNTVLVTDIPTNIYKIGQIIARLDKRTAQVLIEARVIETVLGDDEKMGIDWTVKITAAGAKRPTTMPFDFIDVDNKWLQKMTPAVQTGVTTFVNNPGGQTDSFAPADFPLSGDGQSHGFPFALKDNFTFGTLDFTEFKAVLEMLSQRSDTETVSNPRIATLNNMKATINVGETINMPTFERNSTTGKMEITGYESKDAGIILNVTPNVNDNNEIALDLTPEITNFEGFKPIAPGSDIYAPLFNTRQARTQVMVGDGQTIFIGGLISERNIDRDNKLPIIGDALGDVPYLGLLFKKKETMKQRVELIFFITVHLMAKDKVIKDVPQASSAYVPMFTDARASTKPPKKRIKQQ